MTDGAIDPLELRRALGTFATGVTVVTTIDDDGAPRGFTANSFTSVSLDPPLILVCLAKTAASHPVFRSADRFAVNILSEQQKDVSAAFASRIEDRFAGVRWAARTTGCPVFEGVVAWLDCRTHAVVDGGDHDILIGRVLDYDYTASSPLGFCRGAYISFGLAREAVRVAEADPGTRLVALIEHEDAILFERDSADGKLDLPSAPRMGAADDPGSLLSKVKAAGVDAELSFLFAVYEDSETGIHSIVYRGEARGLEDRARSSLIRFAEIPWADVREPAVRSMIERYVREREEDAFGIYVGDTRSGRVRPLARSD